MSCTDSASVGSFVEELCGRECVGMLRSAGAERGYWHVSTGLRVAVGVLSRPRLLRRLGPMETPGACCVGTPRHVSMERAWSRACSVLTASPPLSCSLTCGRCNVQIPVPPPKKVVLTPEEKLQARRDEADKESLLSRQSVLLGELYELTQPLVGAFRHESAYFWIVTTGHMFVKASTLAFRCYTGHYRAHVALATRTQSSHSWLVYLAPQHFSRCASTEFGWLHCCTASRSRTPSCTG